MATINVDVDLQVKCCPVCAVQYALPKIMVDDRFKNGGNWYCPNGHTLVFTETTADKLKKELKASQENAAYWENRKNEVDRELKAKKGEFTKLKNRVANGVCPCCKRSFVNLHKHISTKHPDFKETS